MHVQGDREFDLYKEWFVNEVIKELGAFHDCYIKNLGSSCNVSMLSSPRPKVVPRQEPSKPAGYGLELRIIKNEKSLILDINEGIVS